MHHAHVDFTSAASGMVHAPWPGGANRHRGSRLLRWRVAPWKGATATLRSGEDSCWVKDGLEFIVVNEWLSNGWLTNGWLVG